MDQIAGRAGIQVTQQNAALARASTVFAVALPAQAGIRAQASLATGWVEFAGKVWGSLMRQRRAPHLGKRDRIHYTIRPGGEVVLTRAAASDGDDPALTPKPARARRASSQTK